MAIEVEDESTYQNQEEEVKTFKSLKEEMNALKSKKGLEFERLVQKDQSNNLWMVWNPSGNWRMVVRIDESSREISQLQWLQGSWDISLPCTLTKAIETISPPSTTASSRP